MQESTKQMQFIQVIKNGEYINNKKIKQFLAKQPGIIDTILNSKIVKTSNDIIKIYNTYALTSELIRLCNTPYDALLNMMSAGVLKICTTSNNKIQFTNAAISYGNTYNTASKFSNFIDPIDSPLISIPVVSEINACIPKSPIVDLIASSIDTQNINEEFTKNTIKAIEERLTLSKNGELKFKRFKNSKYFAEINRVMDEILFDITLYASPKKGESAGDFFNRYLKESSESYMRQVITKPCKGLAWAASTILSNISSGFKGAATLINPITQRIGTSNPLKSAQEYTKQISDKPLQYVLKFSDRRAELALAVQRGVSELSL